MLQNGDFQSNLYKNFDIAENGLNIYLKHISVLEFKMPGYMRGGWSQEYNIRFQVGVMEGR